MNFGAEAQMDRLAAEVGIEPLEIRRRNALAPGDRLATSGQIIEGALPTRRVIDAPVEKPGPVALGMNQLRIYLNLHQHLEASPLPRRGQTLVLEMFAKPGYGTGAEAAIPLLSLGLRQRPFRINPFGLFHLDIRSTVSGPLMAIPASGSATYSLAVPNDPRLRRLTLYGQAAILHANVADWRFSPRTRSVIQ